MGSSKVEGVMSDCFILASIIWVRALHPFGAKGYMEMFGKCRTENNYYAKERFRGPLKNRKIKLSSASSVT